MNQRNEEPPTYLYKIISPDQWKKCEHQKYVIMNEFDKTFIHLSKDDQLDHVIQKFWGSKDYVILKIDIKKLIGRLVYETNPGGTNQYYHLYDGKIPLSSVKDFFFNQT